MPDNELSSHDIASMRRALDLARQGVGLVSPGALVGAVLKQGDALVGEGFYTYAGVDHAEILALRQAGDAARGATLYVSLEPCCHFGRTPPCAEALIRAGVSRVVAAARDTNPAVNGKGFEMLRAAGVEVVTGVLEEDARRLNEAFFTYKAERRPFGILKMAMTLDGKIATAAGESQWITSEQSRAVAHQLRHAVDAVVTGSGTFIKDSPRLTDRSGLNRRRSLLRVVLDRRGQLSDLTDWLVYRESLEGLSRELYAREIQSFMLECGPDLAFNAVRAGIIDKIVVFMAPKLLGGSRVLAYGGAGAARLTDAIDLEGMSVQPSGPDLVCTAYVKRKHSTSVNSP